MEDAWNIGWILFLFFFKISTQGKVMGTYCIIREIKDKAVGKYNDFFRWTQRGKVRVAYNELSFKHKQSYG